MFPPWYPEGKREITRNMHFPFSHSSQAPEAILKKPDFFQNRKGELSSYSQVTQNTSSSSSECWVAEKAVVIVKLVGLLREAPQDSQAFSLCSTH